MSLKYKIFGATSLLALGVLITASMVAIVDFQKDKMAQIYELNVSQNQAAALQLKAEISQQKNVFKKILSNYKGSKFSRLERFLVNKDQNIVEFWVFDDLDTKPAYINKLATVSDPKIIKEAAQLAFDGGVGLKNYESMGHRHWLLALKIQAKNQKERVVVSHLANGFFMDLLSHQGITTTYLINSEGLDLLGNTTETLTPTFFSKLIEYTKTLHNSSSVFEFNQKEDWIVAMTQLGVGDLHFVTLANKATVQGPIRLAWVKALVLGVLLVCLTVLLSIMLANGLTVNLRKIMGATKNVGAGDFDVKVDIHSKDEFGRLATDFNHMTVEIKRLLDETAEKTRMEGELETARMVQSNLFPELNYEDKDIKISGYYEPASECGGDWWFHSHVGSKTYLWIGDATGHGASAALVTSAAKSAANVAQQKEGIEINEILELMNNAIYETTHGNVNMTFLLACYDHETQKFSYSRASHDPAIHLQSNQKPLDRKSLHLLFETTGRRLGEKPGSQYEIEEILLNPGDQIFFYTDGITELYNKEKKMFGDRNLYKYLCKSFNENVPIDKVNDELYAQLEEFRDGEPLHDDVTYFLFERKAG